MPETEGVGAALKVSIPKRPGKVKGSSAAKAKSKPTHPKTSDMVNVAIKNLKERRGSSLQAIKKYIAANYKVDAEKMAPFIRKYLKSAVSSGSLVQKKGKGASGSFKLSADVKMTGKKSSKSASGAKSKKPKPKKSKTTMAPKKEPPAKKAPAKPKAAKPSTPSKTKKVKKAPTKKPKAPKPNTVRASKAKAV